MIKYLGSKRLLVEKISDIVLQKKADSAIDLFSGTSRVGYALKAKGIRVLSNDMNSYAHTLATCYVQANKEDVEEDAKRLIEEFNGLKGSPGYFTETFCVKSRFFQPKNGERVDAIREEVERKCLTPELKAVVLTSLMEAADRVDSTLGIQMAYLKQWAPRAHKDIELRLPTLLPQAKAGKGQAYKSNAADIVGSLDADVLYLDPPYNQHSYLANYHVWESLVVWDKPVFYGVSCKREDVRKIKSSFNSKKTALNSIQEILQKTTAKTVLLSFSNEGFVDRAQIERLLSGYGAVTTIENEFNRYIGSKTGIYNPEGQRVGEPSHTKNKEFIYVCDKNM